MARNRQKAKERQARRKAQGGSGDKGTPPQAKPPRSQPPPEPEPAEPEVTEAEASAPETPGADAAEPEVSENGRDEDGVVDPDEVVDSHLRAGAPPETVGRSDEVLEYEQDLESSNEEAAVAPAADVAEHDVSSGPQGHRGGAEQHAHRPRFVQFLFAVVAELRRVQWPDRQALTTLTGVVLGFVVLAGTYLGLLDAIVSRFIQEIL
jgi:preprotein translocase SecE subunit